MGVIIAGGQSRRFNHDPSRQTDKFLMPFGKTTLLGHIINRARQQIPDLILNVNGDARRVASYGLDVIKDDFTDTGPLGGIYAAMTAAIANGHSHIITFSGDSPFFPDDYVTRLAAKGNVRIALARSGEKYHPVMGIFNVCLRDDLKTYLTSGERRVMGWIKGHAYGEVVWDMKNPDPFFNINRIADLEKAEQYLTLT